MPLLTPSTRTPRRRTPGPAARFGAALAAALLAVLLGPPAAGEAAPRPAPSADPGAVRWAVQPSGPGGPTGRNYFTYDLAPGDSVTDHVGVTNLGDRPLTFAVYGTDAYTTTDGAFALLPSDRAATDVGAWIGVERRSWTVQPGRRADIPFRLTVPRNATPGDHTGGVIAAVAQDGVTADGQRVRLDQRIAARVYLRVAGEVRPAVTVESVRVGYDTPLNPIGRADLTVTYRIRNSGNVRVGGTGAVVVAGPGGWTLSRTSPVDLPELLPGAEFTVTERVTGVPPALRLTATVDLAPTTVDTALPPVQRTASVWATPWLLIAALAAAGAWLYLRRRRRRPTSAAPSTTPGPAPVSEPSAAPAGPADASGASVAGTAEPPAGGAAAGAR
ncbi:WxL protein peptidoglycan domain-containing protein [Micromonospora aurantiaca (nom. illeg.)]|uniref:WxL protein peptidoglycan domain-containing protein n=1 Tax=Micromonospora aurantiaca (nom. illeg.) TaxID=47850 RepID=UPI003668F925